MSFCISYNIVAENHGVQDPPFDAGDPGGSISSSRLNTLALLAELSYMFGFTTVPFAL